MTVKFFDLGRVGCRRICEGLVMESLLLSSGAFAYMQFPHILSGTTTWSSTAIFPWTYPMCPHPTVRMHVLRDALVATALDPLSNITGRLQGDVEDMSE